MIPAGTSCPWILKETHYFLLQILFLWYLSHFERNYISFFLRFYLFIFRERGREGERKGEKHVWLPLVHPLLGTLPIPRHVP